MTDEQLIFGAANAAEEARVICGELWQQGEPLDNLGIAGVQQKVARLKTVAAQLNCAAMELNNRANGVKPPKIG